MFVPRALRLKGVREPPRPAKPAKAARTSCETSIDDVTAALKKPTFSGPRFTTPPITPQHLDILVCGIELLFSDYAHQDTDGSRWLEKHYRVVDGEEKFVHLSAILEHPKVATLKPVATQILLRRAFMEQGSDFLELAKSGYHVRRRPSTYPLRFVPKYSFNIVDDEGLSFWDRRTIYVEPHARGFCKTPAKVAQWLKAKGQLKEKWLPIQAVHILFNSCAFVVLSGNVTHENIWQKWRELDKPECWKVMTKVEHTKRTNEYLVELKKAKPWLKLDVPEVMEIDKPLKPMAEQSTSTDPANHAASNSKKKRKRKAKTNGKSINGGSELSIPNMSTNRKDAVDKEETQTVPLNEESVHIVAEELKNELASKKAKLNTG